VRDESKHTHARGSGDYDQRSEMGQIRLIYAARITLGQVFRIYRVTNIINQIR